MVSEKMQEEVSIFWNHFNCSSFFLGHFPSFKKSKKAKLKFKLRKKEKRERKWVWREREWNLAKTLNRKRIHENEGAENFTHWKCGSKRRRWRRREHLMKWWWESVKEKMGYDSEWIYLSIYVCVCVWEIGNF